MGGLQRAARKLAKRTPNLDSLIGRGGGGGFQPTQLGDPDFSRAITPGSQLQFPAAASEGRVNDVRVRALNQLNAAQAAGIDTSTGDFDEIRQASRDGFIERKRTLGESLLGWVGAPFETINLFIQDFIDVDKQASLRDYGNALWGSIEDLSDFEERTGFKPRSFSETLTMFGWAPAEEFGAESIFRGVVDFTGSMIIDPLTYVTGGLAGLGRTTALSFGRKAQRRITTNVLREVNAVRKAHPERNLDELSDILTKVSKEADNLTDWERHLVRTHGETDRSFRALMEDHVDEIALGDIEDDVVRQLGRYLGGEKTDDAAQGFDDIIRYLEGGESATPLINDLALGSRIEKELLRPLNQRNFAAIEAFALKELPEWSRGGLRLGLPAFSTKLAKYTVPIPGTIGLGKKVIGDPVRDISKRLRALSPKYGKLADAISSGRTSFDGPRALMNGMRDGTLKPWQYMIGATAFDNLNNKAFVQQMRNGLAHHARLVLQASEEAGEDPKVSMGTLLRRLEQSGDAESLAKELDKFTGSVIADKPISLTTGETKLGEVVEESAKFMREILDDLHGQMSLLDPAFREKYIDGYITHTLTKEGRKIINQLLGKGAAVPQNEWVAAAERGEPGKGLLIRILNASGRGGQAETSLGSTRFKERVIGRFQAQEIMDAGPTFIEESYLTDIYLRANSPPTIGPQGQVLEGTVQTKYAGVEQVNEWVGAAVRGTSDDFDLVLPRNWDGKIFEENPFQILSDYVESMDNTIRQWTMIDAMKMAGLVVKHSTAVDPQDVLQNVLANIYRVAEKLDAPIVGPSGKPITRKELTVLLKSGEIDPATVTDLLQQSVLVGKRDLVDGIPRTAIPPMKAGGLDPLDMLGTRQLYQTVEHISRAEFRLLRIEQGDFLPEAVGAGFKLTFGEGGGQAPTLRFVIDASLNEQERAQLVSRAMDQLDALFMKGKLKGKLNHKTMTELAERAPNDETSDLLHTYFKKKMASLDNPAREYLGTNPGEFVETTALADDFYDGINEFIANFTAKMKDGQLVQEGRQGLQLAGPKSQFVQDLEGLTTAARDLQERGYDEAVDIMRNVMDVTGITQLPDYINPQKLGLGGPALEGMVIQKDLGLWLKNVVRNSQSIYTPEGVAAAKLATNELLRTWRALATIARPAFHIRNAIGAAWMNMSVGVRGQTYRKLANNTLRYRKAIREGVKDPISVLDADVQAVWRAAEAEDILSGFVASESVGRMNIGEKREKLDFLKVWDTDNFVATRVGGRVMESIEDVARMALFMEYFQEGVEGSARAAREMVHAIHFDYSNLTPLETKFKAFIPFFVWTRRNLPRQLEMMVERPGLVQRYKHLMQAMNDNLGGQDDQGLPTGDLFSAYAAGTGFYVNPNTPFWARVMIDPDLPTSDLLTIPNLNPGEIGNFINNLLGPHIGTLIDLQQSRDYNDVNAPAALIPVIKSLVAVGLYNETIDGDVRIPYWARQIQETALPFTRELIDPLTGGPTDPNRQQRSAIKEDDNPLEASLKNVLATLGRGFGIKFNTPVDVRGTAFRSQEELNKVIQDLRARGELPPSDSGGGGRNSLEQLIASLRG